MNISFHQDSKLGFCILYYVQCKWLQHWVQGYCKFGSKAYYCSFLFVYFEWREKGNNGHFIPMYYSG